MRSVICEVLMSVDFSKELDFMTWRNIHDNMWYNLYLLLTVPILDPLRNNIEIDTYLFTA